MIDETMKHIGDGLDTSMRMERKAGLVVFRLDIREMVEQQEWIKIVKGPGADASLELDSSAFSEGLRFNDGCNSSLYWTHFDVISLFRSKYGLAVAPFDTCFG
jgi:hypothetical protein